MTGNHPLNREVSRACEHSGIDVVFGAGNCGTFSGSLRCGKRERGECRSIWGANAHPGVVTVGAISAYDSWMGYSSQGPAPWGGAKKPDLVAPSQFREDDVAAVINSGTSAATAVTAGVMAAMRSNPTADWGPKAISPAALKAAMIASAHDQGGIWNDRTGHGLLDAKSLCQILGPV